MEQNTGVGNEYINMVKPLECMSGDGYWFTTSRHWFNQNKVGLTNKYI